jgi:hypothetical protein
MNEIWKDIPDFEGLYQCSDMGRIKSLGRYSGKVLKKKKSMYGYSEVSLYKNKKPKTMRVARLVAESFMGASDLQVDHINMTRDDDRLCNLEYVTPRENQKRAFSAKSKDGTVGVSQAKNGSWRARKWKNKKSVHLGYFKNKDDALSAYQRG